MVAGIDDGLEAEYRYERSYIERINRRHTHCTFT